MEASRTLLCHLQQVWTGDINLQSLVFRVAGRRHGQSAVVSDNHLVVAIHHLQFLLHLLQELCVLDGRVVQSDIAFIAIILGIIDVSHSLHINRLKRLLAQVILHVTQISLHGRTRRIKAAGSKPGSSQEHSGTSYPQTNTFHNPSILNCSYFWHLDERKEQKVAGNFKNNSPDFKKALIQF